MPIYEYLCKSCGSEFETLVRASETPACACGSCGHPGGPGSCAIN
jgi:putative FmdB family regulatory protein